jgi:hypothetical protein
VAGLGARILLKLVMDTVVFYAIGDPTEIDNEVVRLLVEAGANIISQHWERFTPELRK